MVRRIIFVTSIRVRRKLVVLRISYELVLTDNEEH